MRKPGDKARALLVEDHPLTRDGLRAVLERGGDVIVVGEAADGEEAVRLAQGLRPDLIVMDVGLPGCDGIEATRRIKDVLPETKVVILTAHSLENEILAGLAAGAEAYCIKSIDSSNIVTAVKVALEGSAYLDPTVAQLVLKKVVPAAISVTTSAEQPESRGESCLTPRETDVLKLIAEGMANHEISKALHISVGTVKGHVRDILEKLYVNDRTQAAVVALRKGLI
ncbi:MAG TPA: response regulator transcription factor [Candidatus Obscuribacterales bacterium]